VPDKSKNTPNYLLIIANSGRLLAQAAQDAGVKSLVIDLYADCDTQRLCTDWRQVPSLAQIHLQPALDYFLDLYSVQQAIYGSGFEYHQESLLYLNTQITVLGNLPITFKKIQNKTAFFKVLDELNIPYPETTFKRPLHSDNWLIKPWQGQGGIGIKRYQTAVPTSDPVYWQKHQPGIPHSVLFLADGKNVKIIGFNRQWTTNLSEKDEFLFSGIINHTELSNEQKQLITQWLTKIVPIFKLKGLNSLDFIQSGKQCWLLEINPRLSASMQLYPAGLLNQHIQASQGKLLDTPSKLIGYTAYQVIYAPETVTIPAQFNWPTVCVDLPASGVTCRKGQPICSMIAHHNTPEMVFEQLQITQQLIFHQLQLGSISHGIQS
jgi:methenyltetrahydromethanopterin cyclohydrolase